MNTAAGFIEEEEVVDATRCLCVEMMSCVRSGSHRGDRRLSEERTNRGSFRRKGRLRVCVRSATGVFVWTNSSYDLRLPG